MQPYDANDALKVQHSYFLNESIVIGAIRVRVENSDLQSCEYSQVKGLTTECFSHGYDELGALRGRV